MLLLVLSSERVHPSDRHIVELLLGGHLGDALRSSHDRMERIVGAEDPQRRAALGQLMGRAMLAGGYAEDAEDLFQKLPKAYESISRGALRWLASLDQGALALHLNRLGRAAEAFNLVADEEAAPAGLRVEAMAGLAVAMHRLGSHIRAQRTLREAGRLADENSLDGAAVVLRAMQCEFALRRRLECHESLSDRGLALEDGRPAEGAAEALDADLSNCAQSLAAHAVGRHWVDRCRLVFCNGLAAVSGPSALQRELNWAGSSGFATWEDSLRIDAALALLARDDARSASSVLGALTAKEPGAQRPAHALELQYCASKLFALNGRSDQALSAYKEYARELLYRSARERALVPSPRFLEKAEMAEQKDAAMLRLPLRYRRAYAYIIEHLDDPKLSVRQVAAHVDVTERALQMAFRAYLGISPAEMIRHRRMEQIRRELCRPTGGSSVRKTAERWGMTNRSTLAHNYRERFAETPSATLRGHAREPS